MTMTEQALRRIAFWLEQIGLVMLAQQDKTGLHVYVQMEERDIPPYLRRRYPTEELCQVCLHPVNDHSHITEKIMEED